MKNIKKVTPFKSSIKKIDLGVLTTLSTDVEVSTKDSISFEEKTLSANYIYDEEGSYSLVYTVITTDGNSESFVENDGILPTLFLSPNQETYISVVPYHPNKELEISIPVFNRENIELPKGNRPFTGKFIGILNQFSIFYDVDMWSDTKQDKLLAIEFKDDKIKKKHNLKVDLPRNNKIFIAGNEIHLLAKNDKKWLHRQIDEKGNVKHQRHILPNQEFFWQILCLSFEEYSYVLCEENGKISIEIISTDGTSKTKELITIKDEFFNTWQPIKISKNTFITQFNSEFGNGWLTTKNDQLLEIFYSKGENGYKNLLTNEILEMDKRDFVISSINKTTENSYSVIFYPMTDRQSCNQELIILNREIK
ncbi:hypothetical protein [Aquimarina sp. I32.4]|uniref:hypothetical protein n=1 Tax=Aquimarina sp. I32.4 TaxID=2053903 RepID=UPI000CDEF638|nr:hypothetical protein [Aquimarina sp. I32.4]